MEQRIEGERTVLSYRSNGRNGHTLWINLACEGSLRPYATILKIVFMDIFYSKQYFPSVTGNTPIYAHKIYWMPDICQCLWLFYLIYVKSSHIIDTQ